MKKFFGLALIATGVMVFANLLAVYAPTMLSATVIEHLKVVAKIASAGVAIGLGGIIVTSKPKGE